MSSTTAPCKLLRVQRLSEAARLPVRGSEGAAGYDLASAERVLVPAGGRALVRTDLAIGVPPGTYGRVAPRSGLAVKRGICVGAGVVDADYTGNVGVVLLNHGVDDFQVLPGDRIAQLVLERIETPDVQEVVGDLTGGEPHPASEQKRRGACGFGSTGV